MTIPIQPALTNPTTPPTRADPGTFDPRADAFLGWLPTGWADLLASLSWIAARAQDVYDWAVRAEAADASANSSKNAAKISENNAAGSANAAANSASALLANKNAAAASATDAAAAVTAAQGYASIAQAVSPDSPIRINTAQVKADFTLASGYNAASAGPIEIAQNITVTISDNATWSIN